ncbi:MAG: amidohydrolase [Sporomusaceae bacterium]|nr:amidohydrolase [Sporomusaceae bacterium]
MTTILQADTLLLNGLIYTADGKDSMSEAVAIAGQRLIFVGTNEAATAYKGPDTKVIDLQGKFVIPGMSDTHLHPPGLSLLELYEVQLHACHSIEEYIAAVTVFRDKQPKMKAIYGRGWSWGDLSGEELAKGPRKEYLDAVSRDRPIILRAHDGHTLWLNSKAFEVYGITEATVAPEGGLIERDPVTGQLWGTLKESAMRLVALPEYTLDQYKIALKAFQQKMHRLGITSILALSSQVFETIFTAFQDMEANGELLLHVRGAATIRAEEDLALQLGVISDWQQRFRSEHLAVTTAKFFTDGVVEGRTSCLLTPYEQKYDTEEPDYGRFLWDKEALFQAFYAANQRGLQIHVHSTGDRSTQFVLDALAKVRQELGKTDCRNTITHLQLVAAADIARFKELDVIASVQPYWHFKGPNWWEKVDYQLIGSRAEQEFPLQSFFAAGVTVASSSDYPATLLPNPLQAIDIGVTRNIDNGVLHGVADISDADAPDYLLNRQERASVRNMIRSFTINGAYLLFLEDKIGSIEVGKQADLVVLDHNLFTMAPTEIDKVKVVMTFFGGKIVYSLEE